MTTSTSPRPAGATPTRKQLEELDALLQRMLDVPAAPAAAEAPVAKAPRPAPRVAVPAPRPAPVVPVREPAAPEVQAAVADLPSPDDWVRLAATWQPSSQTWGPLADSWKEKALSAAIPGLTTPPPPATAPAVRAPARAPVAVKKEPEPSVGYSTSPPAPDSSAVVVKSYRTEPEPAAAPALKPMPKAAPKPAPAPDRELWPLIAFNACFDTLLFLVWPLRGWLRSSGGRNFLAFIGILSMLAAAALVAGDWFGWTR